MRFGFPLLALVALAAAPVLAQVSNPPPAPYSVTSDRAAALPADVGSRISSSMAATPTSFSYQGVLSDGGAPVPDGTYTLTVRLFSVATGGTALYAETHAAATTGGVFAVSVGAGTSASGSFASVNFSEAVWVEVAANGTTLGPRTLIEPAPVARTLVSNTTIAGSGSAPTLHVTNHSLSADAHAISGEASADGASGVYGEAPQIGVTGKGTRESSFSYGVWGESGSTTGRGILGKATSLTGAAHGVVGQSDSNGGRGVWGLTTAGSGSTQGVFGETASASGSGVFGTATSTGGTTYGGRFESASSGGRGVYALTTSTNGLTVGLWGQAISTSGWGVYGFASATSGTTYGVYGLAWSTGGQGVRGITTATTGASYGGFFQSASASGSAVFAHATAATGNTVGGNFRSDATEGRGISSWASAQSGTTYGVYSGVSSPDGLAGYFVKNNEGSDQNPAQHVVHIRNDSTDPNPTPGPDVLALTVGTVNPGGAVNFVTFRGGHGAAGAIEGTGTGGVAYTTSGADYAEWLPLRSGAVAPRPGDVVGVGGGHVSLETNDSEQVMVVSTAPAVVGNEDQDEVRKGARVAFVGQTPVQLAGPATAGDLLVASGQNDGRARAVSPARYDPATDGPVAGRVLELMEEGRAVALVGVDEAAALRAVVVRQSDEIADLQSRLARLESLLTPPRAGNPRRAAASARPVDR